MCVCELVPAPPVSMESCYPICESLLQGSFSLPFSHTHTHTHTHRERRLVYFSIKKYYGWLNKLTLQNSLFSETHSQSHPKYQRVYATDNMKIVSLIKTERSDLFTISQGCNSRTEATGRGGGEGGSEGVKMKMKSNV